MSITVTTTGPVDGKGIEVMEMKTTELTKGVNINIIIDHLLMVREEMKTSARYKGTDIEVLFAVEGSPRIFTSYCISHSNDPEVPVVLRIMS